jgi:nitronate monooxygenase
MTRVVSGRPARCLANAFTKFGERLKEPPDEAVCAYPVAYDAGKALNGAARAKGEYGYGAQWAGQGAPLARAMAAGALVELLGRELADAGRGAGGVRP